MPSLKSNYKLALTPGEPAGIGPDIFIQLAQDSATEDWVLIADADLMGARAEQLGLPLKLRPWQPGAPESASEKGIKIIHTPCRKTPQAGNLDPNNAQYVLDTLDIAIKGCREGWLDALVTGPVQKSVINDAGIAFSGHTEYLQQHCSAPQVVMMLATPGLRVALVTTHIPLHQVTTLITPQRLEQIITITHRSLVTQFNLPHPRLLVCGLNPHAGESGHLGREELDIINPTLQRLRNQGFNIRGALPADTAFTPPYLNSCDAVIAMYHDQGLPVLKALGFGRSANITLGLPIIRTSVDHGTALTLAATGTAETGSLDYAIATARDLVQRQESYCHD